MGAAEFPHKTHAPLKLACTSCHAGKSERAGLPSFDRCRACHAGMPAPEWKSRRVFRAADFVFFSHGSHASAKVECASCHGAVYRTNALKHEGQMKMSYCMDCHKQRRATIECNACHELAQ